VHALALLATLAKLLAPAHVPGAAVRAGLSVRRSHTMHTSRASHMPRASMRAPESDLLPGVRQDALMASVPDLICPTPRTQAAGRVLPAALLPYAVAQLLPLLLLPPERVRALHVALILAAGFRTSLPPAAYQPQPRPPARWDAVRGEIAPGRPAAPSHPPCQSTGCQATARAQHLHSRQSSQALRAKT